MADRNEKDLDSLVRPELEDPEADHVRLEGYLGKSTVVGYYRMYETLDNRSRYLEFKGIDVVSHEAVEQGGAAVCLKGGAQVKQVTTEQTTDARFLRGSISSFLTASESAPLTTSRGRGGAARTIDFSNCLECEPTNANTHCFTCRSGCIATRNAVCGDVVAAGVTSPTNCGPARTHCSTCFPGCGAHTGLCNVTQSCYFTCVVC
jgi:hypothetical protein